jgi:hypothetical protein
MCLERRAAARYNAPFDVSVRVTSALAVAVSVSLVTSTIVGCATTRGPRHVREVRGNEPPEFNWSRVGELAPATEVLIAVRDSSPITRRIVLADRSSLTVLNLDVPSLPAAASRALLRLVSRRPDLVAGLQHGGMLQEDTVRLGRDGVFVADRRVAELAQVVEIIARDDVTEITGPVAARGSVVGTLIGGYLGFSVGAAAAVGGASAGVASSLLAGAIAVGGYLGFRWSSHETEE